MNILKPCPFCGSKAEFETSYFPKKEERSWIQCTKCGNRTNTAYGFVGTGYSTDPTERLMDRWNRREATE